MRSTRDQTSGADPTSWTTAGIACCRCLDLGLQDPQMRDILLSEGLLEAALPLLAPSAGNCPVHALMTAVEALPECCEGGDGQAGWVPDAACQLSTAIVCLQSSCS